MTFEAQLDGNGAPDNQFQSLWENVSGSLFSARIIEARAGGCGTESAPLGPSNFAAAEAAISRVLADITSGTPASGQNRDTLIAALGQSLGGLTLNHSFNPWHERISTQLYEQLKANYPGQSDFQIVNTILSRMPNSPQRDQLRDQIASWSPQQREQMARYYLMDTAISNDVGRIFNHLGLPRGSHRCMTTRPT